MRNDSFLGLPIYDSMLNNLYQHYHRDVDIAEHHTQLQLDQQDDFINKLSKSPIIIRLQQFLSCKGMLSVRLTGVVVH